MSTTTFSIALFAFGLIIYLYASRKFHKEQHEYFKQDSYRRQQDYTKALDRIEKLLKEQNNKAQ